MNNQQEQQERKRNGMEDLKIYRFQADQIKDTLRMVANVLDSRGKTTSLDRDIMQCSEMIENVLNKMPDKHTKRF